MNISMNNCKWFLPPVVFNIYWYFYNNNNNNNNTNNNNNNNNFNNNNFYLYSAPFNESQRGVANIIAKTNSHMQY